MLKDGRNMRFLLPFENPFRHPPTSPNGNVDLIIRMPKRKKYEGGYHDKAREREREKMIK